MCPKTTKFGPKLAFLVNLGQAMQAYSVPCWLVVWWLWRAGCISQDTYLLNDTKLLPTIFSSEFWPNFKFWPSQLKFKIFYYQLFRQILRWGSHWRRHFDIFPPCWFRQYWLLRSTGALKLTFDERKNFEFLVWRVLFWILQPALAIFCN